MESEDKEKFTELVAKLDEQHLIVAEQNVEMARLSQEAEHWRRRAAEFSESRHRNAVERNSEKKRADGYLKIIAYLSDRLLDSYREVKRENS